MKQHKTMTHAIALMATLYGVPAHAGLLGSTATITGYYPDLSTMFLEPVITQVTTDIEIPVSAISSGTGSLDITDSQIIWHAERTAGYSSGAFNGFGILFSGAPEITSVTLDGATTLTPVSFAFTANTVFFNLAGLHAVLGQDTILNISASPVPLPPSMLLLGPILGWLARFRRRAT